MDYETFMLAHKSEKEREARIDTIYLAVLNLYPGIDMDFLYPTICNIVDTMDHAWSRHRHEEDRKQSHK
jgi:hypothetical protein